MNAAWRMALVVALAVPISAGAQNSFRDDLASPPADKDASRPPAHKDAEGDAAPTEADPSRASAHKSVEGDDASMPTRTIWQYALLGTAIAGLATGVTLVTVNHARVDDYNLGVKTYDQGVNANQATLDQLQALRDSINTGERWGYIVGSVGLAAALGAAYLYVTDDDASPSKGGVAIGPGGLTIYGAF